MCVLMKKIAFINNYFPNLSATFIYREVLELKNMGIPIKTYSIRKPTLNEIHNECLELYNTTTYLIPINVISFFRSHIYFISRYPFKYIKLIVFLLTRKYNHKLKDRIRTIFHFLEGVYLAKLIKNENDIFHIHAHYASHPCTLALVAAELNQITYSFTAHASDIWVDKLFISDKVNRAKFVITCTNYGKKSIIKENSIENPEKISTIYHGVDTQKFINKSFNKNNNVFTILNIGRLSEEKAQKYLIMACKELRDNGYVFKCVIVGDGPYKSILLKMIKNYNLEEKIILTGRVFQEHILEYYMRADIFVLTSKRENLPNVLLESLSMKLPVIAPNIAGIPELIKNDYNGILIPPNDVKSIVKSIEDIYDNKSKLKVLSENGRNVVCKYFNQNDSINSIIKLYKNQNII